MKLTIPLTGTVLVEGSVYGAGELTGDPNDPIRLIDIDLGNVSWRMIDVDLKNEVMEIEVSPAEKISEPELDIEGKQKIDAEGNPVHRAREATEEEKRGFLQHARNLIESHTRGELYQMSGKPRLKRPFKKKK